MDGIHDLGGLAGLGPVGADADEAPFAAPWEGRLHGIMVTLEAAGRLPDGFRWAIERMHPAHYLSSPYYEHWLVALERLLTESGQLSTTELARRADELSAGAAVTTASDPELVQRVRAALRAGPPPVVPAGPPARFNRGDAVAVRRMSPRGHTRCPRYLRGARGTVAAVLPAAPLPDVRLTGTVRSERCYTVAFPGRELWSPDVEPGLTVTADLWESYLTSEARHE